MKNQFSSRFLLSILTVIGMFFTVLHAQMSSTNAETNAPGGEPPPPPPEHQGGPLANLTQAEREQLKAAHDKAIQQNPSLEEKMKSAHQAMEDARKAMHDAMVAIDPSVEPILEKIAPRKWDGDHRRPDLQSGGTNSPSIGGTNSMSSTPPSQNGHGQPPGFANLSPGEQARITALHQQVKNDPAVVAAHEAVKKAVTPEAHREANEALHQVMHDAMLKADPSVAPILEKLHPLGSPQSGSQGVQAPPPAR